MDGEWKEVFAGRRSNAARQMVAPLLRCAAVVLTITSFPGMSALGGQEVPCDAALLDRARTGPYGYTQRQDRCEGLYVREVAGTALFMASFTAVFEDFNSDAPEAIQISWPSADNNTSLPNDSLRILARGIKRDLYYQMDTRRARNSNAYIWPADLLSALQIKKSDVGVVAWAEHSIGEVTRALYVPLHLRQTGLDSATGYEVIVFPTVRLEEVYITISRVGSDGYATERLMAEEPLNYGYYPAERPVRIAIGNLNSVGVYELQIAAKSIRGDMISLDPVWIYYGDTNPSDGPFGFAIDGASCAPSSHPIWARDERRIH